MTYYDKTFFFYITVLCRLNSGVLVFLKYICNSTFILLLYSPVLNHILSRDVPKKTDFTYV